MQSTEFAYDPGRYGLPTRQELIEHRIWDTHYHGLSRSGGMTQHRAAMFYVERMGIERVISLDIGGGVRSESGGPGRPPAPSQQDRERADREELELLQRELARVSGIIRINPTFSEESCAMMEKWIRHGPCIGIKYGATGAVKCSHPNNDPIIRLARELKAVIYIHTFMVVGGTPRVPGGGSRGAESHPADVALLARRFPEVPLICGHSGGDWELGARAIRACENVYFEFSGSDPHSSEVDYAVNELGADRIVWGGHGPSRSFATELSKVFDADLSRADRMKVLGGNYRRLAAPMFRQKGQPIAI